MEMKTRLCSNLNKLLFFNSSIKHSCFRKSEFVRWTSNETKCKVPSAMSLPRYLKAMISFKGPITVSEYMKEALMNPFHGYYMNKDVFGQKGDFITSPEINQLFGELIAIWIITEWKKLGSPKPFYLVELGPGRGTMMDDILRVYKMFNLLDGLSCHLVEMSPEMSRLQADRLKVTVEKCEDANSQYYQKGVTENGVPVYWYNHFKSISPAFSKVVAHEFFDALPIHKFKKTEKGWREVLISVDPKNKGEIKFGYVLAPGASANCKVLVKDTETRDEIEVCPQAGIIMNDLAIRLEQYGGFALVADYGHDGISTDTFRAFKDHKLHDPLVDPGSADLTVDVDFKYLRENTLDKLISFGPITQREFLMRMHIDVRLQKLLQNCPSEEARKTMISGYKMMMDPNQMGDRFKFMSFFPAVLKPYLEKYPVAGFSDP